MKSSLGISMSFVPEDRLGMGLVASMGMTDNMLLKNYRDAKGPIVKSQTRQRSSCP
jgi:simple sugar transport system ATP-binding protein